MRKMRKVIAIMTAMVMGITMLSGCGNSSKELTAVPEEGTSSKPEKIVYEFIVFANEPADMDKVQKAINEITVPEINVEVELKAVSIGSYPEQVNLAITGGEEMDLFCTIPMGSAHFNVMSAQNQLMPLNDLLEEYGTGIKEAVGDKFLKGTTIEGNTYSVTSVYGKATKIFCAMRTDILEETGLKEAAEKATTVSELEKIYEQVYAKNPQMSMITGSSGGNVLNLPGIFMNEDKFTDMELFDDLGDATGLLAGAKYNDPEKVVSYYEQEEVKETYAKVNDWYEKGWVYKDSATTTETCQEIVKQGNAFSYFFAGEVDAKTAQKNAAGYDMTLIDIATNPVQTGSIRKFTWAIPVTSKHPEAAMKFLNMTYTDERIINLLNYGIEDTHYITNEDGTINFADGLDAGNSGWGLTMSFLFGNQLLAKVWEGNELDIREKTKELNETAEISPLLGFSFDNANVSNEVAALTNVIAQYRPMLQSGVAQEKTYDEFIGALKAAGLDNYIAEMQKQLDEFNQAK